MREDAYVEIKTGYDDTGASGNQRVLPIAYATYTPPSPKKKKKVERTRFRETTHTFRQKSPQAAAPAPPPDTATVAKPDKKSAKNAKSTDLATMKPGKKEKIRFGKAPTKTLPDAPETETENAGAVPEEAKNEVPDNPLEAAPVEKKTRFSDRAKVDKATKAKGKKADPLAPSAPDAAEVADRQTQSAPLGLSGDTASKKKKKGSTTTGDKTRLSDKKRPENQPPATPAAVPTPIPTVPGAPAPNSPPQQ
jgi:peptidyl-prolyl cis-trans isomerase SurA